MGDGSTHCGLVERVRSLNHTRRWIMIDICNGSKLLCMRTHSYLQNTQTQYSLWKISHIKIMQGNLTCTLICRKHSRAGTGTECKLNQKWSKHLQGFPLKGLLISKKYADKSKQGHVRTNKYGDMLMAITHTHKNSVSKQKHSVDKHDVRVCKYADENKESHSHI